MAGERRTVIVTGATSGLGLRCAGTIAANGPEWTALLAGRDRTRLAAAAQQIKARTGHRCPTLEVDLASLASIRAAADDCRRRLQAGELPPLHALIDNAGLQVHGPMRRTEDGFELTFGVNHLGTFLFTELVRPMLEAPARVVVVASGTHDPKDDGRIAPPLEVEARALALPSEDDARRISGMKRYTTSKLANILFAYELARRAPQISVAAFDPGPTPDTGLVRNAPAIIRKMLASRALRRLFRLVRVSLNTVEGSGDAMASLVLDENRWAASGRYYQAKNGRTTERRSSEVSYDAALAARLWQDSELLLSETSISRPPA
ncbi:MAG: SDR family NAD(P)-dependent oxidoreductase [Methylobacteriaceae bacterium]|nr:SDR family NAD(P)-dependent oxidoreductase [Methylobacteriaceae bacterium]